MNSRYQATRAALDHFDRIDRPALDAMRQGGASACDMAAFVAASHLAADRVRAAFLADTRDFNSPENVELLSVDKIKREVRGALLGNVLGRLP